MGTHTFQFHVDCVDSLCRICGKKDEMRYRVPVEDTCENFRPVLLKFLGIDTSTDVIGVHSQYFCTSCFWKLAAVCDGRAYCKMQEKDNYAAINRYWTPWSKTVALSECWSCSKFASVTKEAIPSKKSKKKKKKTKAIVAAESENQAEDGMSLKITRVTSIRGLSKEATPLTLTNMTSVQTESQVCSEKSGVDAMPVCIKPEPQDNRSRPEANISHENGAPPAGHTHLPPPTTSTAHSRAPNHVPAQASLAAVGATGTNKDKTQAPSEDAIDYDSVRGVFGWTTLDGVNVPYIIRKFRKFVAVRIVEKKMLSKYPNSFPDELGKKEPLVSYFVTEAEANLLNEINMVHCSFEYGHQPFTTKDLIVDLVEFEEFYKLVKKTFPEEVLASLATEVDDNRVDEKKKMLSKLCGWMQINNTVTPYINRPSGKYVPLSVIVYAAGLLRKENVEGLLPTPEECHLLNATCQTAGFDFSFGKNTRLIHIAEVVQRCQVRIFELPFENPLQHAQYIDSLQQNDATGGDGVPAPQLPPQPSRGSMQGSMSLPYRSKPRSTGPPNMNMFGGPYDPFMSMMNMMTQPTSSANSVPRDLQRFIPPVSQVPDLQHVPRFFPPNPLMQMNSFNPAMLNHMAGLRPDGVGHKTPASSTVSEAQLQVSQPGMLLRGPNPNMPPPPAYSSHHHPPGRPPFPPSSTAPNPFHNHLAETQTGLVIPGLGPVPRGVVPMVGFPPPPGIPPGPAGAMPPPSAIPPLPQAHQAPSRASPRSSGMSPGRERMSPARLSPAGLGHASPSSVIVPHSRDMGAPVLTKSPNQGREPGPVHVNHVRDPVVPIHMSAVAQGKDSAVPVLVNSSQVASVVPVELSPTGHTQKRDSAIRQVGPVDKPPSQSVQNRPEAAKSSDGHLRLVKDITAVLVHNKSISCLVRDSPERKGRFCLVEAVSKLYFPHCKLVEFVHALQNVLKIDLPVCSEEEAKAFIHFYNLPVSTLNDNHMIRLEDLQTYFPQMAYMFNPCEAPKVTKAQPVTSRRSSGSETRLTSPSAPITVVLSTNDNDEVISIDSDPPTPVQASPSHGQGPGSGSKRPASSGSGPVAAKQPCQRLEQMVQRLKKTQAPPGPSGDAAVTQSGPAVATTTTASISQPPVTSASVIVID